MQADVTTKQLGEPISMVRIPYGQLILCFYSAPQRVARTYTGRVWGWYQSSNLAEQLHRMDQ